MTSTWFIDFAFYLKLHSIGIWLVDFWINIPSTAKVTALILKECGVVVQPFIL